MENIGLIGNIIMNHTYPLPNTLKIIIGKDCSITIEEIKDSDRINWSNYTITDC